MSKSRGGFKAAVLASLQVAALAHARAVNAMEVQEVLVADTGGEDKATGVGKELGRLYSRGEVDSPGKAGRHRYYAPKDGRKWILPEKKSRRRRSLDMVREACRARGTALRMLDIREEAEARGMDPDLVARDVANLTRTGEVVVVARVVGDGKGDNLYCPREMAGEDMVPDQPLTWLEEVSEVCSRVWDKRVRAAEARGSSPVPFSTGDVRSALRKERPDHPQLENPQLLVNALRSLATREDRRLRAIRRPDARQLLWAPAEVLDSELNLPEAYASDTERAVEAVRRAEMRAGEPASMKQVEAELEFEPALVPRNGEFKAVLHDAVRTVLAGDNGGRVSRKTQRVSRVGKLDGTALYSVREPAWTAAWLDFARVRASVEKRRYARELQRTGMVPLEPVALGRFRVLHERADRALNHLRSFRDVEPKEFSWGCQVESLQEHLEQVRVEAGARANELERLFPGLPKRVPEASVGWTSGEVKCRFGSLYDPAQSTETDTELVAFLAPLVRRIRNPRYLRRSHPDAELAAESLFDPTSLMFFAARQWGGYELRHLCTLARRTLGPLRDPRFVEPVLESEDVNQRMMAVACLAFLPARESGRLLRSVARDDEDPNVREMALHALALGMSANHRKTLEDRAAADPDLGCREWAGRLAAMPYEEVIRL